MTGFPDNIAALLSFPNGAADVDAGDGYHILPCGTRILDGDEDCRGAWRPVYETLFGMMVSTYSPSIRRRGMWVPVINCPEIVPGNGWHRLPRGARLRQDDEYWSGASWEPVRSPTEDDRVVAYIARRRGPNPFDPATWPTPTPAPAASAPAPTLSPMASLLQRLEGAECYPNYDKAINVYAGKYADDFRAAVRQCGTTTAGHLGTEQMAILMGVGSALVHHGAVPGTLPPTTPHDWWLWAREHFRQPPLHPVLSNYIAPF